MMATPTIGPRPLTKDWFAERKNLVTATDVARIIDGEEGFVVYSEKRGDIEPFAGNEHTRRGQRYERPILEEYAETKPADLMNNIPLLIDGESHVLAATPDAMARVSIGGPGSLWSLSDASCLCGILPNVWGVEAKFSMSPAISRQLGEEDSDELPTKWIWQTQSQMAVTGWEYVDVAVLLFGRLRVYKVQRNERLIDQCRAVAVEMADRVKRGLPPAIDFTVTAAQDAIRSAYNVADGSEMALSKNAVDQWATYQEIGKTIRELDAERKALQASILSEMKNATVGRLGNGLVVKRSIVERKAYTVEASSYVSLRQGKE